MNFNLHDISTDFHAADELIGDIMEYSLQADQTLLQWEPLRKVAALPSQAPSRVRIGPDWTALSGNWFTQWERTNDSQWKDKIVTGMVHMFFHHPCYYLY